MTVTIDVVGTNLQSLTDQYRAITNNLANVNTFGYKREVNSFRHQLDRAMESSPIPGHDEIGKGILNYISRDFTSGTITQSGRPLDLAIEGEGFFVIDTASGPRYTRNGCFRTNRQGQVVDSQGRTLASRSGPLIIPRDVSLQNLQIARDGTVMAGEKKLGQIRLVEFPNTHKLLPRGNGCYSAPTDMPPTPAKNTLLAQGYIEQSNVNAVEELVKLLRVTRLYEAGVKSINSTDERLKELLRVAG